jgi:hypothetical protein
VVRLAPRGLWGVLSRSGELLGRARPLARALPRAGRGAGGPP